MFVMKAPEIGGTVVHNGPGKGVAPGCVVI